jgi:hypothetical protein
MALLSVWRTRLCMQFLMRPSRHLAKFWIIYRFQSQQRNVCELRTNFNAVVSRHCTSLPLLRTDSPSRAAIIPYNGSQLVLPAVSSRAPNWQRSEPRRTYCLRLYFLLVRMHAKHSPCRLDDVSSNNCTTIVADSKWVVRALSLAF